MALYAKTRSGSGCNIYPAGIAFPESLVKPKQDTKKCSYKLEMFAEQPPECDLLSSLHQCLLAKRSSTSAP